MTEYLQLHIHLEMQISLSSGVILEEVHKIMEMPPGGTLSFFGFLTIVLYWGKYVTPGEQIVLPVYYHFHFKAHYLHYWFCVADLCSSLLTKNCSGLGSQSSYYRSHIKQHRPDTVHMNVKGSLLALMTFRSHTLYATMY